MTTRFIVDGIWPELSRTARTCKRSADVAVAYFAEGASSLLRLPPGSRLVVDASERAVNGGQTCPADLVKLVERGVRVYGVSNLHAKVYVFGKKAFIGSANTSFHSSKGLVEAMVVTTDRGAVADARKFVRGLCLQPLTPEFLRALQKSYHRPKYSGGGRRRKMGGKAQPALAPLWLAHLVRENWSEEEQTAHDRGMVEARKQRQHPRTWLVESFRSSGRSRYARGDMVIQVTDEGDGRVLVSPPGNVAHVEPFPSRRGKRVFVYLELPCGKRRRALRKVAHQLGRGAKKRLSRDALVRNRAFKQALLAYWEQ